MKTLKTWRIHPLLEREVEKTQKQLAKTSGLFISKIQAQSIVAGKAAKQELSLVKQSKNKYRVIP